jgi:multiple sugar transport system ATP-binding protein
MDGEVLMSDVIFKDVSKIYAGGVKAVDRFNLEIKDKEFVALVGPSGCGKSTTLRMIAGLEEISEGTVSIDGRVVNDVPPKDRDIAMVFQNYALYPHMTVFDNMAFGLKLRKVKKDIINQRVREAAEILGITPYLERRPKALSGGQRQRVAVGRAIVRKPKVFLFDEPLSNLDAKMRVQMRVEISRLHHKLESTMVYVTHDQVEAMTMGDRIVVMDQGLIQQVADPLTLYNKPANRFVAGFIGTPPMNFLNGTMKAAGSELVFDDGTVSLNMPKEWKTALAPYAGREIIFGIRPEDIGSSTAEQIKDAPRLKAVVDVRELMGSEIYLYLKAGSSTLISRVDTHSPFKVGEQASLALFMAKAHVFDAESGKTII